MIVEEPPYDLVALFSDLEPQRFFEVLLWQSPEEMERALETVPKEIFEALVHLVRLRRAPSLYRKIAEEVSLRNLKRDAAADRIARQIAAWFPPT